MSPAVSLGAGATRTRPGAAGLASLLAAVAAGIAGAVLAVGHPTHPALALAGWAAVCAIAWRSDFRLWLVPALLPIASGGPWTGSVLVDEFDIGVLGAIAAGHAQRARSRLRADAVPAAGRMPGTMLLVLAAFAVATAAAALRGAGHGDADVWLAGYGDHRHAWRIGKGALYALLLLPLLRDDACRSRERMYRCTALGMLAGAALVSIAVLQERAGHVGIADFAASYRTVAWFWEMHVGGAAIDAYVAMAAPFVAWAVARAGTPLRFVAAAALALAFEYACLTTFARGAYLAVATSLVVLGLLSARRTAPALERPRWRTVGGRALAVALVLQGLAIAAGDSYLWGRVNTSGADFGNRLAHWGHGIDLMRSSSDRWTAWTGLGLGRFPSAYATGSPDGRDPGGGRLAMTDSGAELVLHGPRAATPGPGHVAFTQRVDLDRGSHRVIVQVRATLPARLALSTCRSQLLYDGPCLNGEARVMPAGGEWETLVVPLDAAAFPRTAGGREGAVFSIAVPDPGTSVEVRRVELRAEDGRDVLRNGDFAAGLTRWYPVAKDDYAPWHIDNLALELLIERGALGLGTFAALVAYALHVLLARRNRTSTAAPVLAASVIGALVVGLVSSILDAPRIGFLMLYLLALSIALGENPPGRPST
jgi:hypothetical protein